MRSGRSTSILQHTTHIPNPSAALARIAAPAGSALPLPRALLVFAHPDDEVLAVGARLERFSASRLLCVTDGAPRDGEDARAQGFPSLDAYRAARRAELEAALALAGLPPSCAATLGDGNSAAIPDKEAALHLVSLAHALLREIETFQPEAVLTHPYEGGHPDHDSCAFAVHAAVRLSALPPAIAEAPFYHAGPDGMETGRFLPAPSETVVRELSPEESERKRARLACFGSQASILANFQTERELYRLAPRYDFTRPPHPGALLYEGWGWPITGERFRALASEALRELGLA